MKTLTHPTRSTSTPRIPRAVRGATLPAGIAVVQLVLAYEWLVSGINKILNPTFTVQLASNLQDNIKGNPNGWYVSLLQSIVLPHATVVGVLTEIGEFAIGGMLVVSALLWLLRPGSRITPLVGRAACLALISGIGLAINYFLMSGDPMPWIDPGNAFGEGVSIDILIPMLSIPVLVSTVRTLRMVENRSAKKGEVAWAA